MMCFDAKRRTPLSCAKTALTVIGLCAACAHSAGTDFSGASGAAGTNGGAATGGTGTTGGTATSGGAATTGGAAITGGATSGGTSSSGGSTNTSGGTSSSGGGTSSSGGTGGSVTASGGSAGAVGAPPPDCSSGRPALKVGTWVNISPPEIPLGGATNMIAQGIAMDPTNPAILYWGNTPFDEKVYGGLWKTTDAGCTWTKLGNKALDQDPWDLKSTYVDEPVHVRVDPNDPLHMYVADGVRGSTVGFWVSTDGGNNWTKSAGWAAVAKLAYIEDTYDVAASPTNFNHVLVSFHSAWGWTDSKWNTNAGVLESTDGGQTWIMHDPKDTWRYGHAIHFLYDPQKGIGNENTWLLGTQGDGMWRTTDAGVSWTKVTDSCIFHGGGHIYYSKTGVLYASATPRTVRSTDNGATWTSVGPDKGTTGVYGDGNLLYTAPAYAFGLQPFSTSPEGDGINWTAGTQVIQDSGPFEFALDKQHRILYATMWFQGIWALKLPE